MNSISNIPMQRVLKLAKQLLPSTQLFPAIFVNNISGEKPKNNTEANEEIESDVNNKIKTSDYTEELDITIEPNPQTGKFEIHKIPHHLSFDQGFYHAIRAIELLSEKNPGLIIIGVAGPSGSGKTTLASKIASLLDAVIIPLENFIRIEEVREGNMEDPRVVDFDLVVNVLNDLKTKKTAQVPQLEKDVRKGFKEVIVPKSNIVIIDGSYALNPTIRPHLDLTIAINGGVHLDLIKRIMRDIVSSSVAQKDTLFQITNVVFPMFKAFIQPDLEQAKIKIHSTYNPMENLVEPTYVSKAKYMIVKENFDNYFKSGRNPVRTTFSDMYLYPPKYNSDAADRTNWIRIRRSEGHFHIHFYNETMEANINTRPTINFEISVKTISGLLSLGYQIGAILNRTVEIWHDKDGIIVTKEYIKELEKYYVQIKGKNRRAVMNLSEQLHIGQHHIPQTFLYLYFRKLKKPDRKNPTLTLQKNHKI